MKRIFLLLVVLLAASGIGVFAAGDQEGVPVQPGRQVAEKITVTGTISQEVGRRVELVSAGENYVLMYPHYLAESVDISQGETVTVEGFLMPGPRWSADESKPVLRITKAVIRGKEYSLDDGRYSRMESGDSRWRGRMPHGQMPYRHMPHGRMRDDRTQPGYRGPSAPGRKW